MQIAYLAIAALLLLAIYVQVRYAQSFTRSGADVRRSTKIVWCVNIGLLVVLLVVLAYFMLLKGA